MTWFFVTWAFVMIIIMIFFFSAKPDKVICPECAEKTDNEGQLCAAVEAADVQEEALVAGSYCNCCDKCRRKCLDRWWSSKIDDIL